MNAVIAIVASIAASVLLGVGAERRNWFVTSFGWIALAIAECYTLIFGDDLGIYRTFFTPALGMLLAMMVLVALFPLIFFAIGQHCAPQYLSDKVEKADAAAEAAWQARQTQR